MYLRMVRKLALDWLPSVVATASARVITVVGKAAWAGQLNKKNFARLSGSLLEKATLCVPAPT